MAMNVYEPMNIQMPSNPYTADHFRQNMRDRLLQLKESMLSASQPSSNVELGSSGGVPSGGAPSGGAPSGEAVDVPVSGDYSDYGSNYQNFRKDLSVALSRAGISPEWASGITELVKRESGFNPKAKNPTSSAHGYAQFLTSTRKNYEKKTKLSYDNPANQLVMMMQYVKDRYGSPDKALAFWNKNHWY